MGTISSQLDYDNLLKIINESYLIGINQIALHRDMIGRVYFCRGGASRYVLKLYRCHHTENALNSISVLQYLRDNGYPVVSIVPTYTGEMSIMLDTPEGRCVGILYDYVLGVEPVIETDIANIGAQIGRLHEIMKRFPCRLPKRGKEFYVDRYVSILKEVEYSPPRIVKLEELGGRLWKRMELLPRSFCHGDLHSGNMIQTHSGDYVLLDFDVASQAHSIIDVATLCDCTDFNNLNSLAYDSTMQRTAEFHQSYSKISTIGQTEIDAIVAFIAIRHYEIIATILSCEGLQGVSRPFLDEQYEWLLQWEDLCQSKRRIC